MATNDSRPGARGDEAELFRAFNAELMQTVAGAVRETTPHTIEDACAYAWAQFMERQPDRELNWRGWLFRTAQRQAWLLERQVRENVPLRAFEWEDIRQTVQGISEDTSEIHADVQDALSIIGKLPPRLQRIALLRGLGMRHADIAEITGDSERRVQQLITRANDEIHEQLAERVHAEAPSSPRAERLWALETHTPVWLTSQIGRFPRHSRRTSGQTIAQRDWRRAAIALDDFRSATGPTRFEALLDQPARDADVERLRRTALRAVECLEQMRASQRRRELGE